MFMNKKIKCFFCDKELTKEEILAQKWRFLTICFECKRWLSGTKSGKQWKSLLLLLAFCNKLPILKKNAAINRQTIEAS